MQQSPARWTKCARETSRQENTADMLLGILHDDHAEVSERILAASLACDYTVLSDRIAEALLAIVSGGDQTHAVRS